MHRIYLIYYLVPIFMHKVNINEWSLQGSKKHPHINMGEMFVLGSPMERYGLLDIQKSKNVEKLYGYHEIWTILQISDFGQIKLWT